MLCLLAAFIILVLGMKTLFFKTFDATMEKMEEILNPTDKELSYEEKQIVQAILVPVCHSVLFHAKKVHFATKQLKSSARCIIN